MLAKKILDNDISVSALHIRYRHLVDKYPSLQRRDIAQKLSISEAELIDAQIDLKSIRLVPKFADMVDYFQDIGVLMSVTRNQGVLHEVKGAFSHNATVNTICSFTTNDRAIGLHLFLSEWAYGFAVNEMAEGKQRYSLQFFNEAGTAIQKIYLQKDSHLPTYKALVNRFTDKDQLSPLAIVPPVEITNTATVNHDIQSFKAHWERMSSIHQLSGIIRQYNLSREQSFSAVGKKYAQLFEVEQLAYFLSQAAKLKLHMTCAAKSQGVEQVYKGEVSHVTQLDSLVTILGWNFSLQLKSRHIKSIWLVRIPTLDGVELALEIYNKQGRQMAQLIAGHCFCSDYQKHKCARLMEHSLASGCGA